MPDAPGIDGGQPATGQRRLVITDLRSDPFQPPGGDIDGGLPIETVWVAAIFVAIGVIVALAVVIETVAESIISPTAALRKGIE